MREIQLRAWDKKLKKWLTNINPQGSPLNNYYIDFNGVIWEKENIDNESIEFDRVVLMQWTGLKDINGKKIYENDFVEKNDIIYLVIWNYDRISLIDISNGDIIKVDNNMIIKSNFYENEYKFNPKYTKI